MQMKEIFAKRLKSARLLATLSQDKLVKAINGVVSKNAIAKYERAEMMPNSKVLIALAEVLGVKSDYFFRPFSVEIKNIEFRKKSKLKVSRVNSIKQEVLDKVERYIEIEEFLQIPFSFYNPIDSVRIKTKLDIENAVNILHTKWQLGFNALPNIIDLLEDKEVKVIELDSEEEFDGLAGWADGKIPIVVVNKHFTIERKRFTVLHELGHLLLNFDNQLNGREIEKLCHCFAGAMLMPKDTFIMEVGKLRRNISLKELISIKESYGISIQAIMARAYSLKIINKSNYVSFCILIRGNKREVGYGNYEGSEQSNRFIQLVYRAASEEIISMSKAANLANVKLALFREEFSTL
jgi:Zn-dependent peptidase ImmA (M78 family)/DNA-binding XRE family transcriptional regulator